MCLLQVFRKRFLADDVDASTEELSRYWQVKLWRSCDRDDVNAITSTRFAFRHYSVISVGSILSD
jgi:hypothetical protein